VPEDLLRFVRARAGGHPLFVEEVIKALVEAGAITVVERHIAAMSLAGQDLVAAQDSARPRGVSDGPALGGAERTTLQAAAILGDPIDVNVLSNMLGEPMPSLERSIAALKQRDFMVDRGPSELRFASPLIPEIVADSLTRRGRSRDARRGGAGPRDDDGSAARGARRSHRQPSLRGRRERTGGRVLSPRAARVGSKHGSSRRRPATTREPSRSRIPPGEAPRTSRHGYSGWRRPFASFACCRTRRSYASE
jgi:hypothetical protein